jgi:hypothetical protein
VDDDDEVNWDGIRKVARSLARRGVTSAEVRDYGDAASFWRLVAGEVEIIERRRFAVLRGGTRLRLPPDGRRTHLVLL